MGRQSKYTFDEKVNTVLDYKNGKRGAAQICNDFDKPLSPRVLYDWVNIYDKYGEQGFYPKQRNSHYTKEFKEEVVKAYLNGEGSSTDLALEYNIASSSSVRTWIIRYNSHIELKEYNPQGDVYMTKSRKTVLQERIDIVKYCIEHNKEYKLAAKEYDVSYSQVYQWTKKYLESGEEGLIDKRGKHKDDEEIDETQLLRRKVARLEKQLQTKEIENQLLKKVQELERRRYSPKGNKK